MRRYGLIVGLLVSLLAAALTVSAAGSKTTHYAFRGQSADAYFYKSEACVETFVYLYVFDQVGKQGAYPAPNQQLSKATITISQNDLCPPYPDPYYPPLMSASGEVELSPLQFQLPQTLTAGTLDATIEVYDSVSGNSFPVDVNVSWNGLGAVSRSKIHYQQEYPGFKTNSRYDGSYRSANASGTLRYSGMEYVLQPTYSATLRSVKSGDLTISRQ